MQAKCTGPNRREENVCIRCGQKGHHRKDCVNTPKCFLCVGENQNSEHIPGSGKCGESGHHGTECTSKANCFLCIEKEESAAHVPGSGKCIVFRKALEK